MILKYAGQLTPQDLIDAYVIHQRGRSHWLYPLVILYAGLALWLYLEPRISTPRKVPIYLLLLLWPVLTLVHRYIILPWRAKRLFVISPTLGLPFETELDEAGFRTTNGKDTNTRAWSDFLGWRDSGTHLLLYESKAVYRVVPTRVFDGATGLAAARQLFTNRIGPAG